MHYDIRKYTFSCVTCARSDVVTCSPWQDLSTSKHFLYVPDDLGEHEMCILLTFDLEVDDVVIVNRHPPMLEATEA